MQKSSSTHVCVILAASVHHRNRVEAQRAEELLRHVVLAHTVLEGQKEHVLSGQDGAAVCRGGPVAESAWTRLATRKQTSE